MVFHCRCFSFEDIPKGRSNLTVFTVDELEAATGNFCDATKIGEGGFGSVYKGVIWSLDVAVAVRRLYEGHVDWLIEIDVLGVTDHPNILNLIGYCAKDDERGTQLFLVYHYMINRSVTYHLYTQSETPLSWNIRLKIARDSARGMAYLHEEMNFQVILRDFRPSNILLDFQWNSKLADFGLSRLLPQEEPTLTTLMEANGYAAPEYIPILQIMETNETIFRGYSTSKTDVWSYGVFLYELITGRRPLDENRPQNEQKLVEWVKPYLESPRFEEIVDSRLEGNYSLESAQKLSHIASCCLRRDPDSRPKMSEVLGMVNQLIENPSQEISPDKKNTIGIQSSLSSCLSCFK